MTLPKPNAGSESSITDTMLPVSLFLYGGHGAIGIHVTGAGAVSQFTNRVKNSVRSLIFFMGTLFIIVGMTPGTIRPVGSPIHSLAVALVAAGTHQTESVISRITGRGVPEIYSRPVRGVVAFVTLQAGHKMIAGLSCRGGAIVTAGTTSSHQSVIKVRGAPRQGVVATIALS